MPMRSFIVDYNARFAKPPRSAHDAHRAVRSDEILRSILTVRVLRKVTNTLTVQYDRVMYLLDPTPVNQLLVHQYVDVFEFPDGGIEIRSNGVALAYRSHDRLAEVDAGSVVENKRLGHALLIAQTVQAQRADCFHQHEAQYGFTNTASSDSTVRFKADARATSKLQASV